MIFVSNLRLDKNVPRETSAETSRDFIGMIFLRSSEIQDKTPQYFPTRIS